MSFYLGILKQLEELNSTVLGMKKSIKDFAEEKERQLDNLSGTIQTIIVQIFQWRKQECQEKTG